MFKKLLFLPITVSLLTVGNYAQASFAELKSQPQPLESQTFISQQTDEQTIRQLTQQWFEAWSFKDQSFTADELRPLYGTGEILVFDNFDGGVVVLNSFQEYQDTWVPVMRDFSSWEIQPEGDINVRVSGDLAVTTFTWVGNGQLQDGKPIQMRQHGTLVWQRNANTWQIVHEHLTVGNPPQQ
jgi:ketosteroid isomerase-like protein